MTGKYNPFHAVEMSPWALMASFLSLNLMVSFVMWFHSSNNFTAILSITFILLISYSWWRDTERESSKSGNHSNLVKTGLKFGMLLFITSEVMFFLSFFWTFVHNSSSSDIEMGVEWPPVQIFPFNHMGIPLVNTILLLSSGVSVTWCHHASFKSSQSSIVVSLTITVVLGVLFSFLQATEYMLSPFSMYDGVLGSIFFMSTGFHGLHVLIGTLFLSTVLMKYSTFLNTKSQNVGFECSAWYWHFVDVVWLFLYTMVYWWGS